MEWELVMGLEVHVELATKTKIFCSCSTAFGGAPNTHCCPICTGMPGTLPVFNQKVLEYAVKAGLALNCAITPYNKFDRKNYFYPDLPKAYQISQLYLPFAKDGHVSLTSPEGEESTIRIHEIHMEEDAGKLVHSEYGDETYLDYNRCGVPLIEIVSEPDFRETWEVLAYLNKLRSTFAYLGISDCKMEEGSMRADVNLSVRPKGSQTLGTRTELKNINSLKAIERAIAYETRRQIEVLEEGGKVIQETRRWDDTRGETFSMRSKENAQDYRYFPEPDLPPMEISQEDMARYRAEMPEFAPEKAARFVSQFGLSQKDAEILVSSKNLADLFEKTALICGDGGEVRYWIMSQVLYFINERGVEADRISLSPEQFARFVSVVLAGRINRQVGKTVFEAMFFGDADFDIEGYIREHGLEQVDDQDQILATLRQVLEENPKAIQQYRDGQTKITGFFVGQVMKRLGGKANPAVIQQLLAKELAKL